MSETEPSRHSSARTKARKRALDILFEADLRQLTISEVLAAHQAQNSPPVRDFTVELVEGVAAHRDELDQRIAAELAAGWTLERMPRVDRNLARLAAYELTQTSTARDIVLAEAVGLCQDLSTDESPAFLNGLLSSVAEHLPAQ